MHESVTPSRWGTSVHKLALHASSQLVPWKLTELLELSLCLVDDFGGAITPDLLRPY